MQRALGEWLGGLGRFCSLNVGLVALALTLLNAGKPLHMDDEACITYARQFAEHPLNPYDFVHGTPHSGPANQVLMPPVVPYWLGLGARLLGDDPFLWKLWLLPF